eukprot:gb/GFBE01077952.1/.p1 GENE.gb/GFBE01077952.1/~~gb/GFBE01077952.1/.p1  ORF type:complete len:484 (+),score=109.53 gb/GFBE01077952.1/:1-1452(+)
MAGMDGMLCMSSVALGAAISSLLESFGGQQQRGQVQEESRTRQEEARLRQMMMRTIAELQQDAAKQQVAQAVGLQASTDSHAAGSQSPRKHDMELLKPDVLPQSALQHPVQPPGFSMEDARKFNSAAREAAQARKPIEVLQSLQRGNARFWTGNATRPEKSAFERRALIASQFPSTAILACSDSRVPTEIVFDCSLGDMFVCRVAGNCLDTATTASLQYAVKHLEVKVLVVMGHEGCGAIKAAMQATEKIETEPTELSAALLGLKAGLQGDRLANISDQRAYDREAVVTNVKRQVDDLCNNPTILSKIQRKELMVVGAFYEISSGIVDFLKEIDHTSLPGFVPEVEVAEVAQELNVPAESIASSEFPISLKDPDAKMSETSTFVEPSERPPLSPARRDVRPLVKTSGSVGPLTPRSNAMPGIPLVPMPASNAGTPTRPFYSGVPLPVSNNVTPIRRQSPSQMMQAMPVVTGSYVHTAGRSMGA